MPLSLKTVKGVVNLTWSSPTMEASWKIRPSMTEAEMMDTLCRVVIFVNSQNRELGKMEYELIQPQNATASSASKSDAVTAVPQNTETATPGRILMQPPQAGNDRPSDGGPPATASMFEALPTTTVPAELQSVWEMAPPEEMTW